jgi:hypothetical protein
MIFHDESLEMENPWAMEFCEALTLESEGMDSTNEHESFILETSQEPCSFNASPDSGKHEDYNHLKVLSCKIIRRLVVDAFVYHKHCKFRGCTMALTLQLKLQYIIHQQLVVRGEHITNDS